MSNKLSDLITDFDLVAVWEPRQKRFEGPDWSVTIDLDPYTYHMIPANIPQEEHEMYLAFKNRP